MTTTNSEDVVILLSYEQRVELFQQTGLYLCRLKLNVNTQSARPIDRCCSRCLLNDGLSDVVISASGLCNHCNEFQTQVDAGEYGQERLRHLIERYGGKSTPNCVVAYSGGKDSAAALLAAIDYGLFPLAVHIDNGFIPEEVQEAARIFCARHEVPFLIRPIEIARFTANSIASSTRQVPCQSCIRKVFSRVAEVCEEYRVNLVIGGHRFPPLFFPLSVCTNRREHDNIICVSPLLSMRMPEADQIARVKAAGWRSIPIAGNTSNCMLIGFVEEVFYDRFGYNPHIYEVSKEIRAGFYSREEGMAKVARPVLSAAHREKVISTLGLQPTEAGYEISRI